MRQIRARDYHFFPNAVYSYESCQAFASLAKLHNRSCVSDSNTAEGVIAHSSASGSEQPEAALAIVCKRPFRTRWTRGLGLVGWVDNPAYELAAYRRADITDFHDVRWQHTRSRRCQRTIGGNKDFTFERQLSKNRLSTNDPQEPLSVQIIGLSARTTEHAQRPVILDCKNDAFNRTLWNSTLRLLSLQIDVIFP